MTEKPLTLYLNRQEIVTMMTIGDYPDLPGGRLPAQPEHADRRMTRSPASTTTMNSTWSSCAPERETDYEDKLRKKVRTSGCAQGTIFGDVMDGFDSIALNPARGSEDLLALRPDKGDQHRARRSISRQARSMDACCARRMQPLVYMEDVGRHNAVDKIAGWMFMNDVGHRRTRSSIRPAG